MHLKERYWTNLIAPLRHGQCILVLGSDMPIRSKSTTPESDSVRESTFAEELGAWFVKGLEDDGRLPSGTTLQGTSENTPQAPQSRVVLG